MKTDFKIISIPDNFLELSNGSMRWLFDQILVNSFDADRNGSPFQKYEPYRNKSNAYIYDVKGLDIGIMRVTYDEKKLTVDDLQNYFAKLGFIVKHTH